MGSGDGMSSERPVHPVELSRGFWLGRCEVTQKQFERAMGYNPAAFAGGGRSGYPVENVSWDEVQQYIQTLEAQTGRRFRLPTEAEWEYACRAGTATDYSSGDLEDELEYHAVHERNGLSGPAWVGTKEPNAFGLYDMHGNVWEMCADRYGHDYYSNSPAVDPPGPDTGEWRVIRGGGYSNFATDCRSARRSSRLPYETYRDTGFRLVLAD